MSNVADLQEILGSADVELSENNPYIAVEEASGLDELSERVVQVISDQFDAIQRNSSIFAGANASNPVYVNPDDFIFRTSKAPERTTVEIITMIPNLDTETPHPNPTLEETIEPESEEASGLSTEEATGEMITVKDSTPSPLNSTTLLVNGRTAQAAVEEETTVNETEEVTGFSTERSTDEMTTVTGSTPPPVTTTTLSASVSQVVNVEEKTTVNETEEVTGLSTEGSTGESITIKDSTPSLVKTTTNGSASQVVNVEEETTVEGSISSSTIKARPNTSKIDWDIIFPGLLMNETDAKKTTVRSEGITGQTVSNEAESTRSSTSSLGKVTPSDISQATTRGTSEEQSTEAQTELPVLIHSSEHSEKVETSTNVKGKDETSTHLLSQEEQKTTGSGPKVDI